MVIMMWPTLSEIIGATRIFLKDMHAKIGIACVSVDLDYLILLQNLNKRLKFLFGFI